MQELVLKMKEDYQKVIVKLTLFFLSNQVSFKEQHHEKQKTA